MSRRYDRQSGSYEISSLPGKSQVAVCHSFFVEPVFRGHGEGHAIKDHQNVELMRMKYDFAICTVAAGNAAQKAILTKAGWRKLAEFHNRRSCEFTELWGFVP